MCGPSKKPKFWEKYLLMNVLGNIFKAPFKPYKIS